jgi:hypothetical protein
MMDFKVSGAAQLAQGGETTTIPVQDGIAQVQIRGTGYIGAQINLRELHAARN